ncbi:BA14K family protein [Mesorhizobium sp. PUT5]|uniref:BA14K family protein n=1 Tax=Mesorhizobium sp. PUT5 TaxID=3454629 RepID=UPI003FA44DC8
MNRFLKTAIVCTGVGAMSLAALPAANAGDWRWRHHHSNGDAVAAGIAGLAAGALIGGALASQPPPPPPYYDGPVGYDYDYYDRPAYVVRRAPVRVVRQYYAGGLEPWTRDWYDYCSNRYRSFNARTGTFVGYDGQEHFCVAN